MNESIVWTHESVVAMYESKTASVLTHLATKKYNLKFDNLGSEVNKI